MPDLSTTINAAVHTLIDNKTASATTQSLYNATASNDTTHVYSRNAALFAAAIDLTCIPSWNSQRGAQDLGCLITPRIIVVANHFGGCINSVYYFTNAANVTFPATVIDQAQVPGTDILLLYLDSAIDASITPAAILDTTEANYIASTGTPANSPLMLYSRQDRSLNVGTWMGVFSTTVNGVPQADTEATGEPPDAALQAWYSPYVGFDSGSPLGIVESGKFRILTTLYTAGNGVSGSPANGPSLAFFMPQITSLIQSKGWLGGNPTVVSLAGYTPLSSPTPTFTIPPAVSSGLIKIIGCTSAGDDYATPLAAYNDIANYSASGDYTWFVRGGTCGPYTDAVSFVTNIFPGDGFSSLTILPHPSNAAVVNGLIQNNTAGQPVIAANFGITTDNSNSGVGLSTVAISGIQFGSTSAGSKINITNNSSVGQVSIKNCLVGAGAVPTISNGSALVNLSANVANATITVENLMIYGGTNSLASGRYALALTSGIPSVGGAEPGTTNIHIWHTSILWPNMNATGGAMRFTSSNTVNHMLVDLQNCLAPGTASTFMFASTSGTGALIVTASGNRGGSLTASLFATSSDNIGGLVLSQLYADTTNGMTILSNASTQLAAHISPSPMDVIGTSRPTLGVVDVGALQFSRTPTALADTTSGLTSGTIYALNAVAAPTATALVFTLSPTGTAGTFTPATGGTLTLNASGYAMGTLTGLAPATAYGLECYAMDASGNLSSTTSPIALTTANTVALTAVRSGADVVVTRAAVAGGASYALYRSGTASPIYIGTLTSYTDTGAANANHTYTWVAYDTAGQTGNVLRVGMVPWNPESPGAYLVEDLI